MVDALAVICAYGTHGLSGNETLKKQGVKFPRPVIPLTSPLTIKHAEPCPQGGRVLG